VVHTYIKHKKKLKVILNSLSPPNPCARAQAEASGPSGTVICGCVRFGAIEFACGQICHNVPHDYIFKIDLLKFFYFCLDIHCSHTDTEITEWGRGKWDMMSCHEHTLTRTRRQNKVRRRTRIGTNPTARPASILVLNPSERQMETDGSSTARYGMARADRVAQAATFTSLARGCGPAWLIAGSAPTPSWPLRQRRKRARHCRLFRAADEKRRPARPYAEGDVWTRPAEQMWPSLGSPHRRQR
jgi:hypothetical protein